MTVSPKQNHDHQRTGLCIAMILAVSLLVHALSLVLGSTVFVDWRASNYPIHAAIEMAGSVIAFFVAHQLVTLDRRGEGTSFNVPIVGALLGMGILDGLHALLLAGNSFIFLHSLASFCGGALFALAWLPVRWTPRHMQVCLWAVPSAVLTIGTVSFVMPDLVPLMVVNGEFTSAAVFLNVAGGALMFAAAGRIVVSYYQTRNIDDLLFCLHCALFGAASVMFEQSKLWDFPWWGWHVLRLMAYAVALWFIILNSDRTLESIVSAARNRALMRASLNSASESMLTYNSEGHIVDANHAACQKLGYDRSTLLTMHAWELEREGSRAEWEQHWQAIRQDESNDFETVYLCRSGDTFPVEISRALVTFQGEEYICDFARDISERLKKETELRNFKTTLDRISDCVFMFDEESLTFIYANSHALDHVGYTETEIRTMTPLDIKPDFTPARFKAMVDSLVNQEGDVVQFETNHRHRDGHLIPVEIFLHHLTDENGRGRFVATVRDISDRRHNEAALEKARRTAEQASLAKSQFLANMSHELRTPLNGVIGMTELLAGTSLTPQQFKFIDACRKIGESLLELINRILDFSKIEAGKLDLDIHTFNPVQLISDTVDTLRWRAASKGLSTPWHVDRLARQTLKGDSGRVRQVLVNLIGNAIKFTESGSVTLHVRQLDRKDNRVTLQFNVSDTGIGIPSHKQDRLFETFSQVDPSTTRRYGGTGLGLSICKGLVELMGGTIGVRSEQGTGATFWFNLPFELASEIEAETIHEPSHGEQQFNGQVLVAEDNAINQMYIVALLKQLGCGCMTAGNGEEALELLRENSFDVILMDCQMPEMDGFEATRQIRQSEDNGVFAKRVPIIALTANAIKGDRERCLKAGMDEYLSKPVRIEEVSSVLARYLESKNSTSTEIASAESSVCSRTQGDDIGMPTEGSNEDASESLPIDPDTLVERCIGNLKFADSLLDEFEETGRSHVEELQQHSAQGTATETANVAHALKGAAGILCADKLCRLAADIEQASRNDQLSEIDAMISDLSAEMDRCIESLPSVRRSMRTSKEDS